MEIFPQEASQIQTLRTVSLIENQYDYPLPTPEKTNIQSPIHSLQTPTYVTIYVTKTDNLPIIAIVGIIGLLGLFAFLAYMKR